MPGPCWRGRVEVMSGPGGRGGAEVLPGARVRREHGGAGLGGARGGCDGGTFNVWVG